MLLRRIEVRAFRKLGHTVVEGLGDGLNVIAGDNEAGKSTLLAALRAVLFERHRVGGKVAAAMRPHGHDVRPEITIDFAIRGEAFRLRKAFNQRPEAQLTLPGGQDITGDAVEDRLAYLLGFAGSGSRGSKPEEHQGVYGLLWVDQGLAHAPLNAGGGQDSLASALESEVGIVLGGERGRALLARAETRRETFWDKRDRPRGDFRRAQDRLDELEARLAEAHLRLRQHDDKVAALAAQQDRLARCRREDRLGIAARAVEAAQAAVLRTDQLEATLAELRRAAAAAQVASEAAGERLHLRHGLIARAGTADRAAAQATAESEEAAAALEEARDAAAATAQAWDAARRDRRAGETQLAALEARLARRAAREALAKTEASLAEAEAVAARRREALEIAERIRVTPADLGELDRLCAARDLARSRRDAASVQIIPEPRAPTISVDGVPHRADGPLLLARDVILDLPGFGRLRVRPGGGVEGLARAVAEAEMQVATLLSRLGQASRAAAAEALACRDEAQREATLQGRLFAVLAPDGLDALRQSVETLRAAAAADPVDEEVPAEAYCGALRDALAQARRAETEAEAAARRMDAAREAVAQRAAVLSERRAAAQRDRDGAAQALEAARAAAGDDAFTLALAGASRTATVADQAERTAAAALAAADPAASRAALRQAEDDRNAIRAEVEAMTRTKRDLDVELRTLGQEGLGEQAAVLEGQRDAARRQLDRQTAEAAASRLLHTTLLAAQRESKERWLGPVRDRVRPYLRLLHPGTEIALNEKTFAVEHLLRDGMQEPFETLSVGAREQVAVITRLALADILHAAGHAAPVILDDALVNTDAGRLAAMHRVLRQAAERLQVLVLTCRAGDFAALDAPIHWM